MRRLTDRRGRNYRIGPLPGFADDGVAYAAAIVDEARERCIDLIVDMSEEAMWTRPAGSPFSAGDLVVHMNWAELVWLPRIGPHELDDEAVALIERGRLDRLYDESNWRLPVAELVALCRRTRDAVLIACLRSAPGLDEPIEALDSQSKGPRTVREVAMHVATSWIYHSGQVGLMTMQNGLDYVWAFE